MKANLRAVQAQINEKTTIKLMTAKIEELSKKVEHAEVNEKNNLDMMTAKGKLRKEFDEKSLEFLQAQAEADEMEEEIAEGKQVISGLESKVKQLEIDIEAQRKEISALPKDNP